MGKRAEHITKEDIQMISKNAKRCSKYLVIGEITIKTTVRPPGIPLSRPKIKKTDNSKSWWEWKISVTFTHCSWEWKMLRTLRDNVWQYLLKPGGASGKEPTCQCRRHKRCGFDPWIVKIPRRRKWQPTPVYLPGESHGWRSLAGYSPQGCKESDMSEAT